jgi:acetyl esterase/lipase
MKTLTRILAYFSAAASSLLLFRVRSPAGAPLTLPKMIAASLSPVVAVVGALGSVLGLLSKTHSALIAGGLGALLATRYVKRATAPHDGFELAFGPDWQSQITPVLAPRMLKRRWTWRMPASPEPRWERDIPFWTLPGTDRQLLCDVWQPPRDVTPSGLAVVYLHGSGWHFGDKDFGTRTFFHHLAAQGHVVMDVAYRLCPETDLFGMMGDAKRAIAWMRANASRYDVNSARIVAGGGSAGGHLSLLAAYAPDHPELTPEDVKHVDLSVRAVFSIYGPVDMRAYDKHAGATFGRGEPAPQPGESGLLAKLSDRAVEALLSRMGSGSLVDPDWSTITHDEMMINLLGGLSHDVPEVYDLASPITHVGPHCPPTLLLQGEHDSTVPAYATRDLHRKLVAAGVPVVYHEFPQTEHAFDLVVLPRYSPAAQAALYDVDRFLALIASE